MKTLRILLSGTFALAALSLTAQQTAQQNPNSSTAQASQQNQASTGAQNASVAQSLGIFVYPRKHQSPEQQSRDENECFASAKQQTGIDPLAPVAANTEAANAKKGGAAKGAAGGAAGGAAIGGIAGDAGQGAAIGATVGAVHGRRAQKKANKEAEQQAQASAQQQQAQVSDTFKRAMSACLDARDYSVK